MEQTLKSKTIILGVTGGIAAYKSAILAGLLKKKGAEVHVIMTDNALEFVAPLTFETLTGNRCITSMFERNFEWDVKHVSLAKKADAMIIAPATANVIAKLAAGIADDMLTTTALAVKNPKIIAAAMNTAMLENPVTVKNIRSLEEYGYTIVKSGYGLLACGDEGAGRMEEPEVLCEYVDAAVYAPRDLSGKKVLITAGATRESIDPVRFITNRSSGKMGYALAKAAIMRGAEVKLISGPVNLSPPAFAGFTQVTTAFEMSQAVKSCYKDADIIIKAAAVADYRPCAIAQNKLKKSGDDITLDLTPNEDILAYLGQNKTEHQFLAGFCMETENLIENAKKKLAKKQADMIIANTVGQPDSGFEGDNNTVTIVTREEITPLETMSKYQVAHKIFDTILSM